jgi:hypothetical protein
MKLKGLDRTYIELSSANRVCAVKSDDLEAEEVVAIFDAGRNCNVVDASGGDLMGVRRNTLNNPVTCNIPRRQHPTQLIDRKG